MRGSGLARRFALKEKASEKLLATPLSLRLRKGPGRHTPEGTAVLKAMAAPTRFPESAEDAPPNLNSPRVEEWGDLNKRTIQELRSELKARGLAIPRKKSEMIPLLKGAPLMPNGRSLNRDDFTAGESSDFEDEEDADVW